MKALLKTLIVAILLVSTSFAGENGPPDWSYGTFEYSATIPGDDNTLARVVGPAFPQGLLVLREYSTVNEFKDALIRMVDALNATGEPILPLKRKAKKRR